MYLCVSLCIFVYLCVSLCIFVYLCVSLCIFEFVYLCVSLCIFVYLCVSLCIFVYLCVSLCIFVYTQFKTKEADALIRRMAERMSAKSKDRRDLQQCSELPEKEIQVRPAKDVYNSAERLQEAIEHSSEDRDRAGHGCEGIRYILLRITDVICTDF